LDDSGDKELKKESENKKPQIPENEEQIGKTNKKKGDKMPL
jgi:hypothetical protein